MAGAGCARALGPVLRARNAELPMTKSRLRIDTITEPHPTLVCCWAEYAGISDGLQFIPPANASHFGRARKGLDIAVHQMMRCASTMSPAAQLPFAACFVRCNLRGRLG